MLSSRSVTFVALAALWSTSSLFGTTRASVADLIAHPARYNGKVLSVSGYYGIEHHGPYLCIEYRCHLPKGVGTVNPRIWLDFSNATIPRRKLERVRAGYVTITGTFQFVDMRPRHDRDGEYILAGFGWMSSSDKQLTRITTFTRASNKSLEPTADPGM